jgi:hypothetical protein
MRLLLALLSQEDDFVLPAGAPTVAVETTDPLSTIHACFDDALSRAIDRGTMARVPNGSPPDLTNEGEGKR